MQGTWVWSLVLEVPRVYGSESVYRNYWCPSALEPVLCNRRSHHNKPLLHYGAAPARCDSRKPACSDKDRAQPKPNKYKELGAPSEAQLGVGRVLRSIILKQLMYVCNVTYTLVWRMDWGQTGGHCTYLHLGRQAPDKSGSCGMGENERIWVIGKDGNPI